MAIKKSVPRSLAPLGHTTSLFREHLNRAGHNDPEWKIASRWADANRQKHKEDVVPVQQIAHQCTGKCTGGKHVYPTLEPRDVKIISATVQWFATPEGREFYQQFLAQV